MKNVEVLNLYGTNVQGLTTTNIAGLEQVNLVNVVATAATGAGAIGINLAGTQSLGLNNVTGGQIVTASFGATSTAATLNLSNGSNVGAVNLNGAALKTLNIHSTGKANTVAALASTGSENKVVFTGDQKATVTAALADTVKTVDASASTGGVSVTAGNADVTFTGGSGNDTIKFAAGQFTTLDVVDGGAGSDILSLADVGAPSSNLLKAINAAKNFETVAFSGGGSTLDAAKITNGATNYQVDTVAGNFVLTNVTSAGTVSYFALDNSGRTDSIANKLGDLTSNVTLTANSTSAAKTGAMTLTGINTVNLKSNFTGTGSQATANAFGTINAGNTDNTTFVITGSQDLVLARLNGTTTGSTVDASGFTGKLTATGSGKADSLTGGSGADKLAGGDITGNTVGTKEASTITVASVGVTATDLISVTVAGTTVTAQQGASTAAAVGNIVTALTSNGTINPLVTVTSDAVAGTVTVTWNTAGNKTDLTVSGAGTAAGLSAAVTTNGTDISAGVGTAAADILTGGAGTDTFVFNGLQDSAYAADASTVDTITDFTAASDKLDVSGIIYNVVNSVTAASSFGSYQAADFVAQSTVQASVNAASPSTLAAAVTAAATQIAADKVGAFQYNGDTYVFLNDNNAAVTTADGLIKLSGAVELAATDFVFAA